MLVGVISDTHGLIRPEALRALAEAELIIHAGDVGTVQVLEALEGIAPVHAVTGNTDGPPLSRRLPATDVVPVGELQVYVLHDLGMLDLDPAAAGFAAVISGHSHRSSLREDKGVLYLNPGSAGPRRFDLPVSVALLRLSRGRLRGEIIEL